MAIEGGYIIEPARRVQITIKPPEGFPPDRLDELRLRAGDLTEVNSYILAAGLKPQEVQVGNYRKHKVTGPEDGNFLPEEVTAAEKRPCWIFKCKGEKGDTVLKAQTDRRDPNAGPELTDEIHFYTYAREALIRSLPPDIQEKVDIPRILRIMGGKRPIFQMEQVDGKEFGSGHYEASADISRQDVDTMLGIIFAFHNKPISWWQSNARQFYRRIARRMPKTGTLDELQRHKTLFDNRRPLFEQWIGPEYTESMANLLSRAENQELFSLTGETLSLVRPDFTVGNMLKSHDGKVYVIDWAVAKFGHPATGSAYLIENLWQNKELYDHSIRRSLNYWRKKYADEDPTDTVKANRLFKHAYEHLRFELIYLRLSGVAVRFYGGIVKNEQNAESDRNHAKDAMNKLAELTKEVLDQKGVWQEFDENK